MPALATHVRWVLALCAAGAVAATLAVGVDGWAATLGTALGLVLLAEFVAGVAWLASRAVRREMSEPAQMRRLVGAWRRWAALVVWGHPW